MHDFLGDVFGGKKYVPYESVLCGVICICVYVCVCACARVFLPCRPRKEVFEVSMWACHIASSNHTQG